jgi:hypothetical protein
MIKKSTASGDAVLAGRRVIKKVVLTGGSDAATVIIFSGVSQAVGVDVGKIAVPAGTTKELCFDNDSQIFETGLSLTVTGTSPVVYTHY